MVDVFVSYKRRLRPRVEILAYQLQTLKVSVWFDARLDPGSSFNAEIAQNVRSAPAVVVCWSPDCFPYGGDVNGWVCAEARIGRERGVLAPVFLERCDLDPPFNNDHVEDLSDWTGADDHPGYVALLRRMGALLGRPGLATYVAAKDAAALKRWVQAYPEDPLAEDAWAQVEAHELEQTRARLSAEREAAVDRAKPPPAPVAPPEKKIQPVPPPPPPAAEPAQAPQVKQRRHVTPLEGLLILAAMVLAWFLFVPHPPPQPGSPGANAAAPANTTAALQAAATPLPRGARDAYLAPTGSIPEQGPPWRIAAEKMAGCWSRVAGSGGGLYDKYTELSVYSHGVGMRGGPNLTDIGSGGGKFVEYDLTQSALSSQAGEIRTGGWTFRIDVFGQYVIDNKILRTSATTSYVFPLAYEKIACP